MQVTDIVIRQYIPSDRDQVRKICSDTAFMGEAVTKFFDDPEVFADFAISYYTDYEPESLFVAQHSAGVVGYIAGCCDTNKYKRIFNSRILPRAILRSLSRNVIFNGKAANFLLRFFKSLVKGEFNRPDIAKGYPAHLHINLVREARGFGAGSMLMNKFLGYLKEKNIPAVHLSSIAKGGQEFFSKTGFDVLYSKRVTYFDHLVKEPLYLVCFGKRL